MKINHHWIILDTPPGKAETKAIWEDIPMGPYLLEPQHNGTLEGMSWMNACDKVLHLKLHADPWTKFNAGKLLGFKIFANVGGKAVLIAYHFENEGKNGTT